jgi:protein involved in polysaccharide export with SLBB domain
MIQFSSFRLLFIIPLGTILGGSTLLFGQKKYSVDPSIQKDVTGYKLRTGDSIRIIVQGEADAMSNGTLNNYGMIKPTYISEIKLSGLNVSQAEALIAKQYQDHLIFKQAFVSVVITKYTEQVAFLSGSVARKGPYAFPPEVEAMSIVEVIARAGGFSDIAKKIRVYVTRTFYNREGEATNTKTYEVDVEALSKGMLSSGSPQRFWIYPGDRIQVPERLF